MGFYSLTSLLCVAEPLQIQLPTENKALLNGHPEQFFMYVDRNFEGEVTQPWEGGAFGYVRSPIRVGGEVVMTRFHEGIDIQPIKRDKAGNPLDLVMSISEGKVVHISPVAGRSNYGKYVVVEHQWDDSRVYSLYAHLAEITVGIGDPVIAGSVLGRMGYTGVGLNRTRAHLHLEVALMMSANYEGWHAKNFGSANYHGNFNGMNLAGVDVTALFLERAKDPNLTFSQFVLSRPMQFKVTIPLKSADPDFLQRHPWMKGTGEPDAVSWEIGFAATGHAISFTPSTRPVNGPTLTHLRPSEIPQRYLTRGLLTGEGTDTTLSSGGKNMLALVLDDFPIKSGR
ncbi:M23 family metallopeptidase [Luteolibacter sp. AS25]|uniref:M23 family metallopeptidase n=1 Tax=Luteolibacter sp. AS25 TaxID=3135776 RepID=UPI00398B2BD5